MCCTPMFPFLRNFKRQKAPPQFTQELLRVVGANDRTSVTQLVTVSWNGEARHIPKDQTKESTCTMYTLAW